MKSIFLDCGKNWQEVAYSYLVYNLPALFRILYDGRIIINDAELDNDLTEHFFKSAYATPVLNFLSANCAETNIIIEQYIRCVKALEKESDYSAALEIARNAITKYKDYLLFSARHLYSDHLYVLASSMTQLWEKSESSLKQIESDLMLADELGYDAVTRRLYTAAGNLAEKNDDSIAAVKLWQKAIDSFDLDVSDFGERCKLSELYFSAIDATEKNEGTKKALEYCDALEKQLRYLRKRQKTLEYKYLLALCFDKRAEILFRTGAERAARAYYRKSLKILKRKTIKTGKSHALLRSCDSLSPLSKVFFTSSVVKLNTYLELAFPDSILANGEKRPYELAEANFNLGILYLNGDVSVKFKGIAIGYLKESAELADSFVSSTDANHEFATWFAAVAHNAYGTALAELDDAAALEEHAKALDLFKRCTESADIRDQRMAALYQTAINSKLTRDREPLFRSALELSEKLFEQTHIKSYAKLSEDIRRKLIGLG